MKKLILAAAFVFCFAIAASAKYDPSGTFKGFTTIKISGMLTEDMMSRIAEGEPLHIYKELYGSGFFTVSLFLDEQKNGSFAMKDPMFKASFKPKTGKYSYSDKSPFDTVFAIGSYEGGDLEVAVPEKGGKKCSGTIEDLDTLAFYDYPIALSDGIVDSEDLCGLVYPLEQKGKNFAYAQKDADAAIKITVNAKGKASATLKFSGKYVFPKFFIEDVR